MDDWFRVELRNFAVRRVAWVTCAATRYEATDELKAPADMINAWAKKRGWSQIDLVSGFESSYQADYQCQGESDDAQHPGMHVFKKENGDIFHFWGTEMTNNDIDMVWPYWNLTDLTPAGRPDRPNPPQNFRSKYLEDNYLNQGLTT